MGTEIWEMQQKWSTPKTQIHFSWRLSCVALKECGEKKHKYSHWSSCIPGHYDIHNDYIAYSMALALQAE